MRYFPPTPTNIPRSITFKSGRNNDGVGRSWTFPVYLLNNNFADIVSGDEDPLPTDNGNPHPFVSLSYRVKQNGSNIGLRRSSGRCPITSSALSRPMITLSRPMINRITTRILAMVGVLGRWTPLTRVVRINKSVKSAMGFLEAPATISMLSSASSRLFQY
ncbi:hypothetical protein GUJ93_ZPchr0008g13968 [Zizania palustris]|uniref:Uncharacterized protein n=1 Tax=Zizania palustris TaxID=103762 RepID=A0A8J5RF56_ZIZPA|nr:hypothetical protein GUJ93_ZPchr0008g13968 [Zizania palustris]